MYYRQLRAGVNDYKSKFIEAEQLPVSVCLKNPKQDYYLSIYKYNQDQFEQFQRTNSVKGIDKVVTDKLIFDFDNQDPEQSRQDAALLCVRLMVDHHLTEESLCISFSGNKGFHVEIFLNEDLTKEEFKFIVRQVAVNLKTFDVKIFDHARPFRLLGSYHLTSGLYKTRLTLNELQWLTIEEIKELSLTQERLKDLPPCKSISLPETMLALKNLEEEFNPKVELIETGELNWKVKPKNFPSCRWAIYNGLFKKGERHEALMSLVSYFKNQGKNKTQAYHATLGTIELQAQINNCDEYDKNEFYKTCVESIYSNDWKNGQYSCREKGSWLNLYCLSLGENRCKHKEDEECFIEIDDFADKFTNFAKNIEKNTLKFGIPEIDNNVMITTSMLVGLLGAPSAGKTTLLLNFLEQTNRDKIHSVFFSMDMGLPLIYLRLIQKNFGYSKQKVFDMFLNNPIETQRVIEAIKEKYKYTKFSFRTGLDIQRMREAVLDHEDKIGTKVKLVGIDYLERIKGPYSDPTANSGQVCNEATDMANDLETCVMMLLQTQKQSGDPSDPLLSMRNVKGASVIEQACSVIMTLSRPGFSPVTPEDDQFATISLVKGRIDTLFSKDLRWDGLKGEFSSLEDSDIQLLNDIRNRKKQEKELKKDDWKS